MDDFRKTFRELDETALITIDEYGQLLGITSAAMSQRRHYGDLAEPAIQGGKLLRWRAGDVRVWLRQLKQDSRPTPGEPTNRTGRPRSTNKPAAV